MNAIVTQASPRDASFVAGHEGFVSRAYRCPAGVITIAFGFTMGSRIFADYWRQTRGRALQMGDTITREEADALLPKILTEEYGAAVAAKVKPQLQHEFGAATSMAFNCGTGSLGWKWAQALARRTITEAAALLRTTATTANGRHLPGLVRRRADEARLLETGDYGVAASGAAVVRSPSMIDVRWYQQALKDIGRYSGPVDGDIGTSDFAVRAFQRDAGLVVDGAVGAATRAALIRALDAKRAKQVSTTSTAGGATVGAGTETVVTEPSVWDGFLQAAIWGGAALVVVLLIFAFIRYRGVLTGRRVPT